MTSPELTPGARLWRSMRRGKFNIALIRTAAIFLEAEAKRQGVHWNDRLASYEDECDYLIKQGFDVEVALTRFMLLHG